MKKWIIGGFVAIIVIIAVVLFVGISNLGPIIKNAVNTYGPNLTKTEVRLGDVKVSVLKAEAEIRDFFLGNPKGFQSAGAIGVDSVYVDVDEKSLTGDTIVINRIEVAGPDVTYEKKGSTDNFKTILKNIQASAGSGAATGKEAEKKGAGKKIIIKDFIIRDGKVTLAATALGGNLISTPLPDIHLKDIGKEKNGASPAEAFATIFNSLYGQITSPDVTKLFNEQLKGMGATMDTLGKEAQKQVESVTKGVTENMGKTAEEGMRSVTKSLKGLMGD